MIKLNCLMLLNILESFRKELCGLLRPAVDSGRLERRTFLSLCPTHFQFPYLFGYPKIHKPGVPLRPIVNMAGSLFAGIGRFLAKVLAPFNRRGDSFLRNSADLVEKLRALDDLKEGVLVSFDVESLFTNVPLEEAVDVVRYRLEGDEDLSSRTSLSVDELVSLVRFCLTCCYFRCQDEIYVQVDGVAMGGSVSVVVANLYMFFFEEMALKEASKVGLLVPDVWFRYVDDVVARFKSSDRGAVLRFLEFVNGLRQSIKFTVEFEVEVLNFLDVTIDRRKEAVTFSVFRKPTHTNRYLNRTSCHPRGVFKGVVSSLALRARQVFTQQVG